MAYNRVGAGEISLLFFLPFSLTALHSHPSGYLAGPG